MKEGGVNLPKKTSFNNSSLLFCRLATLQYSQYLQENTYKRVTLVVKLMTVDPHT